jgi:glutathionylspermidine synthase
MNINDLHKEYRQIIEENMSACRETSQLAKHYMQNCSARFRPGIYIKTLAIPKLYTSEYFDFFNGEMKILYGIFEKVAAEYKINSDFRKKFGFSKELEELINRERTYKSLIPIARIDLFYNDETGEYKFCEFNTDGSSAMNEDRELNNALKLTEGYKIFSSRYKLSTSELFYSWVDCFNKIYKEFAENTGKENKKPNIAITDFLNGGTNSEFEVFKEYFEKAGYYTEICDIRDFKYENGKLISPSGKIIDAVYRRAVTVDIMNNYDSVQPFINAVKDNNVCTIGDFRTQLAHNKILFKILWDEDVWYLFNENEQGYIKKHIPFTALLSKENADKFDLKNNKDKWIIKPQDSYASKGFYSGAACAQADWEKAVDENIDTCYIMQEFCMPYKSDNIDLTEENSKFRPYTNLLGLFTYDGKVQGLYTRSSNKDIISTQYDEMTLPTVIVDKLD